MAMIPEMNATPHSDTRQIKPGLLLGEWLQNPQTAAFRKNINPPIRRFVSQERSERRTAQFSAPQQCIVAKNFTFKIAPDRGGPPPPPPLKAGGKFVRMGEVAADIHIAAIAIVPARSK